MSGADAASPVAPSSRSWRDLPGVYARRPSSPYEQSSRSLYPSLECLTPFDCRPAALALRARFLEDPSCTPQLQLSCTSQRPRKDVVSPTWEHQFAWLESSMRDAASSKGSTPTSTPGSSRICTTPCTTPGQTPNTLSKWLLKSKAAEMDVNAENPAAPPASLRTYVARRKGLGPRSLNEGREAPPTPHRPSQPPPSPLCAAPPRTPPPTPNDARTKTPSSSKGTPKRRPVQRAVAAPTLFVFAEEETAEIVKTIREGTAEAAWSPAEDEAAPSSAATLALEPGEMSTAPHSPAREQSMCNQEQSRCNQGAIKAPQSPAREHTSALQPGTAAALAAAAAAADNVCIDKAPSPSRMRLALEATARSQPPSPGTRQIIASLHVAARAASSAIAPSMSGRVRRRTGRSVGWHSQSHAGRTRLLSSEGGLVGSGGGARGGADGCWEGGGEQAADEGPMEAPSRADEDPAPSRADEVTKNSKFRFSGNLMLK